MKKIQKAVLLFLLISQPFSVLGFVIENNPSAPVENNFLVGPAKIEKEVEPGESKVVSLVVENRTGKKQNFKISFEDFVGTNTGESPVELLGEKMSATTLKNFLFVERDVFSLEHGDKATIPVSIAIPGNVPPGGRFAAIIVSAYPSNSSLSATERTYTGALVLGRIAALTFVNVRGESKKEGSLVEFATKQNKKIFFSNNIPFRLVYKNTGEVNLNPYGIIEVKNIFNSVVSETILDPWYALPGSLRTRDVAINKKLFGFYKATAQVNRGYDDIVDQKEFSFVVIPPVSLIGVILVVIVLGITLVRFWKQKKNQYE